MNFLIDECLHTSLVQVAVARGYQAAHVAYRGLSGMKDWTLMTLIRNDGFTFVTNKARDFRRLYARAAEHAGLILLVPHVRPAQQRILFAAALDDLDHELSLVNEALEVHVIAGDIELRRYDLPGR